MPIGRTRRAALSGSIPAHSGQLHKRGSHSSRGLFLWCGLLLLLLWHLLLLLLLLLRLLLLRLFLSGPSSSEGARMVGTRQEVWQGTGMK